MNNEKLTFIIHDSSPDYCGMCQQLGPNKYGGPKMHRSLPTDTYNVEGKLEGEQDSKWVVLCSDCLNDAHKEKNIIVQYQNGVEFLKGKLQHFFIRGGVES